MPIINLRIVYIDPRVLIDPSLFSRLFNVELSNMEEPICPEEAIDICQSLDWKVKDMTLSDDNKVIIIFEKNEN